MSLRQRTVGDLEKALYAVGALKKDDAGRGIRESWGIAPNGRRVFVYREILGMGHCEPRSYGVQVSSYTEKDLNFV